MKANLLLVFSLMFAPFASASTTEQLENFLSAMQGQWIAEQGNIETWTVTNDGGLDMADGSFALLNVKSIANQEWAVVFENCNEEMCGWGNYSLVTKEDALVMCVFGECEDSKALRVIVITSDTLMFEKEFTYPEGATYSNIISTVTWKLNADGTLAAVESNIIDGKLHSGSQTTYAKSKSMP